MKLHLPTSLYRSILVVLSAAPVMGAGMTTPESIVTPAGFQVVDVTSAESFANYSSTGDVAFKVAGGEDGLVLDSINTALKSGSGAWYITSADAETLSSLSIINATTRPFSAGSLTVENLASLTASGIEYITYGDNTGGAFCKIVGTGIFNNNGVLSFVDNSRSYETRGNGGVFFVSNSKSLSFSNNNAVCFDGNTASSVKNDVSGGAIYGQRGASISLADNKNVRFSDNKAYTIPGSSAYSTTYAPKGGAIYIGGSDLGGTITSSESCLSISGNENVLFSGNIAEAQYSGQITYSCYGGAVYAGKDTNIAISDNDRITFDGNKAQSISTGGSSQAMSAYGGAIAAREAATVVFDDNDVVEFKNNEAYSKSAESASYFAYGGAVYLSADASLQVSNTDKLSIIGNSAVTSSSKYASYLYAKGGAIYGDTGSTIALDGNTVVEIKDNKAYSTHDIVHGGAIYGDSISISGNNQVTITGNLAQASKSTATAGAICGESIVIAGNDQVLIANNAEIDKNGVRMFAIKADTSLELSAGENQEIRIHDVVQAPGSVLINASAGGNAGGSVIFDAAEVASNLSTLLDRAATSDEIRMSSTSKFGETTQQSGALQLLNGARLVANSYAFETPEGVAASLVLDSGKMRADSVSTSGSSTLSFSGDSYALFTDATLADGTTLEFTELEQGHSVRLAGDIRAGELSISVAGDKLTKGQSYCLFTLAAGSSMEWDASNVSISGVDADDVRLVWNKGSLYLDYAITNGGTLESMLTRDGSVLSEECQIINQSNAELLYTSEGSQKFALSSDVVVDNKYMSFDALVGHYELTSADASAPVNLTIQNLADACMGGLDSFSDIRIHHLNEVSFLNNQSTDKACSINLYSGSTAELNYNKLLLFESYPGEGSAPQSHQISVSSDASLLVAHNDKVLFKNNYAYHGAGIFASEDASIEFANNLDVEFTGNGNPKVNDNSFVDYGGAIYAVSSGAEITFHDNQKVTFRNNYAEQGGAIYIAGSSSLKFVDNAEILFTGNGRAEEIAGMGGGILVDQNASLEMTGNDSISFQKNATGAYGAGIYGDYGSSVIIRDNEKVSFTENMAAGGAGIYMVGGSTLQISDNKTVSFVNNVKRSSSNGSSATAIYSYNDGLYNKNGNVVNLSNNEVLEFLNNEGAGIRMSNYGGSLHIQNNGDTVFEGNYIEDIHGNFTLRSMTVGTQVSAASAGKVTDVVLSAAQGKSIVFNEGLSIKGTVSVSLNSNYVDAENKTIAQTGDIVFSAAKVRSHLTALKPSGASVTENEIKDSSTFSIEAETKLYGGRLLVEEGAIFTGQGLEAMEGSAATVQVKNATLDHTGYNLVFNSGTKLEVIGNSSVMGNLVMKSGSAMVVDAATMNLSGTTSIGDTVSLSSRNENATIAKLSMAADGISGAAADSGMRDVTLNVGNETYFLSGVTLNNVVLNTSANTAFSLTDVAVDSGSSFSLGNGGSVVMSGKGMYDIGSATALSAKVSLADDWTGTVKLTGSQMAGLNLDDLAKGNNSSVELSGVSGYLSQANGSGGVGKTYSTNVILTDNGENAAWSLNNGWSGDKRTFAGSISGKGTIKRTSWRGTVQNIIFAGDISQWTGAFSHEVDAGSMNEVVVKTNLTFNGSSEINAEISTNGKGELNVTLDDANVKTRATAVTVNKKMTVTTLTLTEGTRAVFMDTLTSAGQSTLSRNSVLNMGGLSSFCGHDDKAGFFAGVVLNADSAEGGSLTDLQIFTESEYYGFSGTFLENVLYESSITSTLTLDNVSFSDSCSFDVGADGLIALSGVTMSITLPALPEEHDGILMLDCSNVFHCAASGDMVISLGMTREELELAGYKEICIDFGTDVDYSNLTMSIDGTTYIGGQNGMATFTMVPEPATATLSLLALTALVSRRRRR